LKWVWTPKGWLVVILVVIFLGGAAFLPPTLSNISLIIGGIIGVIGYVRTAINVSRHNKLAAKQDETTKIQ
jgi:hypothetical protein